MFDDRASLICVLVWWHNNNNNNNNNNLYSCSGAIKRKGYFVSTGLDSNQLTNSEMKERRHADSKDARASAATKELLFLIFQHPNCTASQTDVIFFHHLHVVVCSCFWKIRPFQFEEHRPRSDVRLLLTHRRIHSCARTLSRAHSFSRAKNQWPLWCVSCPLQRQFSFLSRFLGS